MKITLSLLATIEGDLGALTDPANEAADRARAIEKALTA